MKKFLVATTIIFNVTCTGFGQAFRPFPQNIDYPYGYSPATISSEETLNTYTRWKELLLVPCSEGYRVVCESPEETRVEAIGFGMLITAYTGDKEAFDGLYHFYQSKRTVEANQMMAWNVSCEGINDPGSATDGDIDVAFALIVAHNQWGGDYLNEANEVIRVIKNTVVIRCDSLLALAPGYSTESETGGLWGGCNLTDIQYYTPAFFRVFARVSADEDWDQLADDTYSILHASAHPKTGLVPDWQSVSGTPGGNSVRIPYFRYDACRVPWRIALDYLWNGTETAGQWCKKVSGWAHGIGPENIRDGYNLDGTENNQGYHNSAFVGGFAVAAMCNSQEISNAFGTEMGKLDDTHWFSLCTRTLYLLTITGNFWEPDVPVK